MNIDFLATSFSFQYKSAWSHTVWLTPCKSEFMAPAEIFFWNFVVKVHLSPIQFPLQLSWKMATGFLKADLISMPCDKFRISMSSISRIVPDISFHQNHKRRW